MLIYVAILILAIFYLFARAVFRRKVYVPPQHRDFAETGYYINDRNQIWGPNGATGILVEDNQLLSNGNPLGVYIEDDYFFRRESTWFNFVSSYEPTGHKLDSRKRILGDGTGLPWLPTTGTRR